MSTTIRRALAATTLAAGILVSAASSASAQTAGTGWRAWVGCWTPAVAGQTVVDLKTAPVLCVSPTANPNAIQIATIGETKVLARDTIDASGITKAITTKNCTGSETARWSADERRVYLNSTTTCDGLKSTTSAILAMTPEGEWIDVRGVNAGEGSQVRVARYRAVQIPTQLLDSLAGQVTPSASARVAAGAAIGNSAIMEASKIVDPAVVESWILERGQKFSLDAATLVQLADAGIPARVTDAMIAISNPGAFKLARADGEGAIRGDDVRGNRIYGGMMGTCDGYSRYFDSYDCRYGYDRFGYNNGYYGYGSGYGYGYGGYYGGYYGSPVVVVVNGNPNQVDTRGQAVKGRGYTQGGSNSNGTASARDRQPQPSTSNSGSNTSAASSSSSGSSSSSSSGSSSSGERTAHGRP